MPNNPRKPDPDGQGRGMVHSERAPTRPDTSARGYHLWRPDSSSGRCYEKAVAVFPATALTRYSRPSEGQIWSWYRPVNPQLPGEGVSTASPCQPRSCAATRPLSTVGCDGDACHRRHGPLSGVRKVTARLYLEHPAIGSREEAVADQ